MATPASSKKRIVDSIKESTNILVTVSNSPSVDELSAALGLAIFLNNLGKHATAIASGEMPPAITFLEPNKTFEATANSLQDFIIALDKSKADHLRFKPEGDVVKIYITPYRTTITSDDLEFSQGDYNVELILALNVASEKDLDKALSAHGKILHDATVGVITSGEIKSNLGTVSWHEKETSGVSEMVAEIINDLKTPKAALDEQIATALLTGIVASTDRFSNDMTSSKVMTMAAELMAAGANQQLIVAKLQETGEAIEIEPEVEPAEVSDDTALRVSRDDRGTEDQELEPEPQSPEPVNDAPTDVMKIDHSREANIDEAARQVMQDSQEDAARAAEARLDELNIDKQEEAIGQVADPAAAVVAPPDITEDLRQATEAMNAELPAIQPSVASASGSQIQPTVGGTLNATTAQAAAEKQRENESNINRMILTHGKPIGDQVPSLGVTPLNAAMAANDEPPSVDIFSAPPNSPSSLPNVAGASTVEPMPPASISTQQQAMDDINAAFAAQPQPIEQVSDILQTTDSAQQPLAPSTDLHGMQAGGQTSDSQTAGMMPAFTDAPLAMPDFSNLPPLPPAPVGVDITSLPTLPSQPPAAATVEQPEFNPGQFQIPNQP